MKHLFIVNPVAGGKDRTAEITALAGQSGDKLVPADLTLKKRAGAENCYDFSAALLTAADSTAAAQVSGTITMVKEDGRWKAAAITLNL